MNWTIRIGLACGLAFVGAAAHAESSDPYQFALVAGSPTFGQDLVRTSTATGASILCPGGPCVTITDKVPPPAGSYRLMPYVTYTPDTTNRAWNIMRVDVRSGRIWELDYDGKDTASWAELTYP